MICNLTTTRPVLEMFQNSSMLFRERTSSLPYMVLGFVQKKNKHIYVDRGVFTIDSYGGKKNNDPILTKRRGETSKPYDKLEKLKKLVRLEGKKTSCLCRIRRTSLQF